MKFWDEAIYFENYLLNQILTRVVYHMTPVDRWCSKKPFVSHLRIVGCVVWEHISDDFINKLDP